MSLSVEKFGKAIVAPDLMSATDLKALWRQLPAGERQKDGETFAKLLYAQNKLTEFQSQELLSGGNTPLVMHPFALRVKIMAVPGVDCSTYPCMGCDHVYSFADACGLFVFQEHRFRGPHRGPGHLA